MERVGEESQELHLYEEAPHTDGYDPFDTEEDGPMVHAGEPDWDEHHHIMVVTPRNHRKKAIAFIAISTFLTLALVIVIGVRNSASSSSHQRSNVVSSPSVDLEKVCAYDSILEMEGRNRCRDACEPASCCLIPSGQEGSCFEEQRDTCESFVACGSLHTPTQTTTTEIPYPPLNLAHLCSSSSILTPQGFYDCETACLEGACCITNRLDNCFFTDIDACQRYAPCQALVKERHVSEEELVKEVCGVESVKTKVGRRKCGNLCRARSCCFAVGAANCFEDNQVWCEEFAACEDLANLSTEDLSPQEQQNSPTSDLNRICSTQNISFEEGRRACAAECRSALCCVGIGKDCSDSGMCKKYDACIPLWKELGLGYRGGKGSLASVEKISSTIVVAEETAPAEYEQIPAFESSDNDNDISAPTDLKQICSSQSLKFEIGRATCEMECSVASCCVSPQDNCSQTRQNLCESYQPCNVLWAEFASTKNTKEEVVVPEEEPSAPITTTIYVPSSTSSYQTVAVPPDLDLICSSDNVAFDEGREECKRQCEPALCCVGITTDCSHTRQTLCDAYYPCESVWFDYYDQTTAAAVESDVAVQQEDQAVMADEGNDAPNTDMTAEEEDSDPIDDSKDETGSNNDIANPPPKQPTTPTKNDNNVTPSHQIQTNPNHEPLYAPIQSSSNTYQFPADLDLVCSAENIAFEEGRRDCTDKCQYALCCIGIPNDCSGTHSSMCDAYYPCSVVWMEYQTEHSAEEGGMGVNADGGVRGRMNNEPESTTTTEGIDSNSYLQTFLEEGTMSTNPGIRGRTNDNDDPSSSSTEGIDPQFMKNLVDRSCDVDMFDVPEDFEDCKSICQANECCFADGEANCVDDREGMYACDVFEACEILLDYDGDEVGEKEEEEEFEYDELLYDIGEEGEGQHGDVYNELLRESEENVVEYDLNELLQDSGEQQQQQDEIAPPTNEEQYGEIDDELLQEMNQEAEQSENEQPHGDLYNALVQGDVDEELLQDIILGDGEEPGVQEAEPNNDEIDVYDGLNQETIPTEEEKYGDVDSELLQERNEDPAAEEPIGALDQESEETYDDIDNELLQEMNQEGDESTKTNIEKSMEIYLQEMNEETEAAQPIDAFEQENAENGEEYDEIDNELLQELNQEGEEPIAEEKYGEIDDELLQEMNEEAAAAQPIGASGQNNAENGDEYDEIDNELFQEMNQGGEEPPVATGVGTEDEQQTSDNELVQQSVKEGTVEELLQDIVGNVVVVDAVSNANDGVGQEGAQMEEKDGEIDIESLQEMFGDEVEPIATPDQENTDNGDEFDEIDNELLEQESVESEEKIDDELLQEMNKEEAEPTATLDQENAENVEEYDEIDNELLQYRNDGETESVAHNEGSDEVVVNDESVAVDDGTKYGEIDNELLQEMNEEEAAELAPYGETTETTILTNNEIPQPTTPQQQQQYKEIDNETLQEMNEEEAELVDELIQQSTENGEEFGEIEDELLLQEEEFAQDQDDVEKLKQNVAEVCNDEMFYYPQGLKACEETCNERMCCFEDGSNCQIEERECNIYDSCRLLMENPSLSP